MPGSSDEHLVGRGGRWLARGRLERALTALAVAAIAASFRARTALFSRR